MSDGLRDAAIEHDVHAVNAVWQRLEMNSPEGLKNEP